MTLSLNVKKFKVKDTWKNYEVTLEVDLNRLTAERAELICRLARCRCIAVTAPT